MFSSGNEMFLAPSALGKVGRSLKQPVNGTLLSLQLGTVKRLSERSQIIPPS